MNRADLETLLDFHYWARDRMLDALEPLAPDQFTRDLGSSFRSPRDTAAHIYGADLVWYQRWNGESPTALVPADQFPDIARLRDAWVDLERQVRGLVGGLSVDDVERVRHYKLLSGAPGASPIWQMLQHVVNHATYHRGQVATMLRQLGAGPLKSTDMITFYRERAS